MKIISDYRNEFQKTKYDENVKRTLISYMSQRKYLIAASTAKIRDFISGEKVESLCRLIYSDGEYEWRSEEIYLIEKYDMKVFENFVNHVMRRAEKKPDHEAT